MKKPPRSTAAPPAKAAAKPAKTAVKKPGVRRARGNAKANAKAKAPPAAPAPKKKRATLASRAAAPRAATGLGIDYSSIEVIPPSSVGAEPGVSKRKKPGKNDVLVFTPDQHRLVHDLSMWGVPQVQIAEHIINPITGGHIALATLHAHFSEALRKGLLAAHTTLARSAYQQAVGSPAQFDDKGNQLRAERYPNPTMSMFLCRVRLRYHWGGGIGANMEAWGAEQAPSDPGPSDADLTAQLEVISDDELRIIRRALTKALPAPGGQSTDHR